MKRTFSLLAACCLLSFSVACGEEPTGSDSTASPTEESTEEPTETPTAIETPTEEPTEGPGGGFTPSGDRPSVEELTQFFLDDFPAGGGPEDRQVSQCMAEVFFNSEISDQGLRDMIVDGDDWVPSLDDSLASLEAAGELFDCIPGLEDFDPEDFDFGN